MNCIRAFKNVVGALLVFQATSICTAQDTKTWNGSANTDWFNPTNWIPAGVPAVGDNLNFNSGTITLTAPVTISGQFNWSGGTLEGNSLTLATNAVMNLTGSGTKYMQNTLTNAGTIIFGGNGDIYVYNNLTTYKGAIYNLAGALFDIQTDRNFSCACYGKELFHNAGLLRKSAGSGITSFAITVTNTGVITTLQGTLNFNSGGLLGGTYNAAAGTLINFNSGPFSYQSNSLPQLNGPGGVRFTGGTLTLIDNLIPNLALVGGILTLGPNFQGGTITNLSTGSVLSGNYAASGLLNLSNGVSGNLQLLSGSTVNWSGGEISGTNQVATGAVLNWSSGTLLGPWTVAPGGVMNLVGSGVKYVENVLTNAGTINFVSANDLSFYNNLTTYKGAIYNLAGALFDIQVDRSFNCACYGKEFFHNAGLLRKSAGSGITSFGITVTNTGTITTLQGTLNFNSGGLLGGTYNAAAGTLINFNSGSFSYQSNSLPQLIGPGGVRFTGGTLTLIDNLIPNLALAGGTLTLGQNFQGGTITNLSTGSVLNGDYIVNGVLNLSNGISGDLQLLSGSTVNWSGGELSSNTVVAAGAVLNWSSGTLLGPVTVAANGVMNLVGSGVKYVENVLTNAGTINFVSANDLSFYNNLTTYKGAIYNLAGALFEIQTDRNFSCACYGKELFHNAGLLRKSAGSGITSFAITVTNTGVITTLQGTLNFNSGGLLGGTYNAAAGTLINFNSGTFSYQANALPQLNGPGGVRFTGGTLTLIDNLIPNLTLAGGILTLGPNFQGGTITNLSTGSVLNGDYIVNGVLNLSNGISGDLQLLSGSTVNWSGGELSSNTVVAAGAVLNWSSGTLLGPLTVATNGVMNLTGSGTKYVQNVLTNAGAIVFGGSGDIYLYNNLTTYKGAIYNLAGALFDIQNARNFSCACYGNELFNNAGLLRKTVGGTSSFGIQLYNSGTLEVQTGTVNFSLNSGYLQTGGAMIFGVSATNNAGRVTLTGPVNFDGTLGITPLNGYTPQNGDVLALLSYGSRTGIFNYLNLPSPAAGLGWQAVYNPTALQLKVIPNGSGAAQITGSARDNANQGVANLTVFAYATNSSGTFYLSTTTDANGNYSLNVSNATWLVGLKDLPTRGYNPVANQVVTVNGANQTANFTLQPFSGALYTITTGVTPPGSGTSAGDGAYPAAASVVVTATANTNSLPYYFAGWTENGVFQSANSSYLFPAQRNRQLVANFALPTYTIAVSNNPSAGGVVSGAGTNVFGTTNTLTAQPNFGYRFTNWTENGVVLGTNLSLSTIVYSNHFIVANYAEANLLHVVTTTTEPIGVTTVSGAGTYTNGQSALFSAPATVLSPPSLYTFLRFTLNNNLVTNTTTFNKTFAATDPTNLQYVAVYNTLNIVPQVAAASANYSNPVPATTNLVLSFRFDRSMQPGVIPTVYLTNSAAAIQPTVPANGHWTTSVFTNDTYVTPAITLATGMDGTNRVFISGAMDVNGYVLATTNALNLAVDATFPVVSNVGATPGVQTALVTWASDEPATSQVDYGLTPAYGLSTSLNGQFVNLHGLTLNGLTAQTTYHFRVRSRDLAGNESVSTDGTFTTINAPDLLANNLQVTGPLTSGGSVVISWNDTNSGAGATYTYWYDHVLVTNVATGQKLLDTALLYDPNASGNVAAGGTASRQLVFHIPDGMAGEGLLRFIVTANGYGTQYEWNSGGTALDNNTASVQLNSTLASYPDLQVANLAITNASLQSGLIAGLTWQDTNTGPGAVTNSFYDLVTVVNLTTAQTLVSSRADYDVSSSGSIGAGQSVNRVFTFPLPNGSAGAGNLRITILTDAGNRLFEYNPAGTAELNNTNSISAGSTLAPYPDLTVTNVRAPAIVGAGQSVQVVWTDSNIGNAAATNSWNDQVFLSNTNVPGGGQLLGTFTVTNQLGVAQSLTFTQTVTIPQFASGTNWFIVKGNAGASFYELNTANNRAVSTQAVKVASSLTLTVSPGTVSESAGTNAVTGSVTRSGDVSSALTVNLASLPGTNVLVPATVMIPAGQYSANFQVSVVDNAVAGGFVVETLSASAAGISSASAPLTILLDDSPALTLTLSTNQVPENAPAGATTGTIQRNVNLSAPLKVTLTTDLPTALTAPSPITIPAGQASVSFPLTPVDDFVVGDTRRARISAKATGFNPVTAMMDVLNADASQLKLSLADPAVQKGKPSPSTIGTVTRSGAFPAAQDVRLSVANNALVTVPALVTIPANAASANFNVSVGDDNLATGTRIATLTAQMLTPSRIVVTNGQTSTILTVLDTHGPSLSLSFANSSIAKGSNTIATLTRNTTTATNLSVTLNASPSAAVTFPAVVDIPSGQASATFSVMGVLDNTNTGPRTVAFNAMASGFNSAVANLTVSDIYVPDLVPTAIVGPTNALTSQVITVNWVVANHGLSPATNLWYDAVYLATDSAGSRQVAFAYATNKSALASSASYTNQATFALPAVPGKYWIVIGADAVNAVTELSKQNNSLVGAIPLSINPLYSAAISNVTPALAKSGTPVTFTGRTYFTADGSPAPLKSATIHLLVNDARRLFTVNSDANGNFSYTFQPLSGEAGDYTVGADYPLLQADPVQANFSLLGMQALPGGLAAQLLPNIPLTNHLVLSNRTSHPLTGLAFTVPDLGPNLSAQFILTNQALPPNGTVTVSYVLQSPLTRSAQIRFSAVANSAEGAQLTIPVSANVVPLVPQLVANPSFLTRGMLVGTQTVVSFEILNTGGASSGDLAVQLPASLPWMALSSPALLPSIPAGGKATVTLTLNPPANLPLTLYTGSLAAVGDHTGVSVPFQFRAVSDGKGDLRVTATDDYTYYVAGAPKVTNALVTLRDAFTTAIIAQTNSDANGIAYFTGMPEGPYTVDATAAKHNQFRGSAAIVTGTTAELEAFMPRQLVTYQWTVVPTEVPDQYTVQLETVFETEVPVPNVVVEEPSVLLLVAPGEMSQFDIKLTNQGLIAANGVTINVPDDPNYIVTPLVKDVGVIPAKSSVTVPVTVQSRAAPASLGKITKLDGGGCDTSQLGFHGCLPSLPLGVEYYYVCGPNNVLQRRSVDLSVACTAKNIKDCLKDLKGVIGSENLRSLGCNTISAFLSCAASQYGIDLDPCIVMGINIACGAITGGAAGAVSGGLGSLPDCICKHLDLIPLPSFPHATPTGSGGDLLLPILPTGSYYVSGAPTITGINIPGGNCSSGPSLASLKTGSQISARSNPLKLSGPVKTSAGGVCARVRLRIEQNVIITRSAFQGTLEIDNGGAANISNVQILLNFQDSTNGNAAGKFFIEGPALRGLTAVDGTGILPAGASGSAVYTFIPTVNAAPNAPQSFQIGGTLSYLDNGEQVVVPLLSAPITVYPEARLNLVYFQQRDVYADDPFTSPIEPSEPFALGLLVKNTGAGSARNLTITSGQPRIVDNEKGLLIDFAILGTQVGDQPVSPSLTARLGDISPGGTREVTWDMISSLQGRFISFNASFNHANELGGTNTSLINSVEIHELTHRVLANRPGDDNLPDFLVNDIDDPDSLPDILYLSDGTVAPVAVSTSAVTDAPAGPGHLRVQLVAAVSNGWNYIRLPNPGAGYRLSQVVRSDGKILSLANNAWTTDRSFPSSLTGAIQEDLLHLFDYAGSGSYTLHYASTNTAVPAIVQVVGPTPFTQSGAVSSVGVIFSALMDTNTFSYTNVTLTRNGGANLITAGAGLSLTLVSNLTYAINGLQALTAADGNYQVTVHGNGLRDVWGNPAGNASVSAAWAKGNAAVVVQSLAAVLPDPRNVPLDSTTVTFSRAIDAATFDYSDISLTRNGGPNLVTSAILVTQVSPTTFTLSGLGALTGAEGSYTLTVTATNINDTLATGGFGAQSLSWTMITTAPKIIALEQLATNPRNIVVPSLNLTFSGPIDPDTFDYRDLTLTRDGGANLITSEVTISPISPTSYRIANLNWAQGYAGTYTLTVKADNIADLAGNAGTGSTNETWTMILTVPPSPANLVMTPDLGASPTDGLTSATTVTFTGSVGASNLTVRVMDQTTATDLGAATVIGTNFSHLLNFTILGHHQLKFTSVDLAGNVSVPAYFDLFLDIVPPTAIIQQVTHPVYSAISSIPVWFSEPINLNTLAANNFVLKRDGTATITPTLTHVATNLFLLGGLSSFTYPLGSYQLTLNLAGVQDPAGNAATGSVSMSWVRSGTNAAPSIAPINNWVVAPGSAVRFKVMANDSNADPLSFTLDPGAPLQATIDSTNGNFSWTPTRAYASTTNPITIRVTDNGLPAMSATRTFLVTVLDYLDVSLGSTNVEGGQSAEVPIYLASSEGVTNLAFNIAWPGARFTNPSLSIIAPEIGANSLQDQATNLLITLQTAPGQILQNTQREQILKLNFTAVTSQNSGFVPLTFGPVAAAKPGNLVYSNYVTHPGTITVVQDQPLLMAGFGAKRRRVLTMFGRVNENYELQCSTNLYGGWQPLMAYTQTNAVISINLESTNALIFYRLHQP